MTTGAGIGCATCGTVNSPGGSFCVNCGARLAQSSAPASAGTLAFLQSPVFWQDVRVRAQRQLLPLAGVLLIAGLDYQLHDQAPVALVILAVGAAIALFFREWVNWCMAKLNLQQLAGWAQPLFFSVPAALYFLLRGRGDRIESTSDFSPGRVFKSGMTTTQGLIIALTIAGLPLLASLYLPRMDASLAGFYALRDRYIPKKWRLVVMIGLSIVVTFGIIHGSLMDVRILFGQTASRAAQPDFMRAWLTAVANVAIAFALLREPRATGREGA